MERLHPAVEDLLRAGEVGDLGDVDPGVAERRRGASGREDLDPEPLEAAGELGDRRLVGDGDQRASHPDGPTRGRRPPSARVIAASIPTAPSLDAAMAGPIGGYPHCAGSSGAPAAARP